MTTQATTLGADAGALAAAFRGGEASPVEVLDEVLADIEARNGVVNAFSDVTPERARADAAASAERWARGEPLSPLDGVPVTVKENMVRAGQPYRSGTAAAPPAMPERDAPIVERLTEAGAVIVGTTTMPDWGMLSSGVSSAHGITRSPLNPALTVGGSSSGAGAAAAAGWGPIHMGTDIGGSVRFPAAWLGLTTLKPSDGRIPLDTPYQGRAAGPIARTVADVALAMSIVTRPDARDYTSLPYEDIAWMDLDVDVRGMRIALQLDAGAGIAVDPEITRAVREAAEVFAAAGGEIVELEPFIDESLLVAIDEFWRVRFWRTYAAMPVEARAKVLPYIAQWVIGGADVPGTRVLECYESIAELRRRTVAATDGFDAVLSPVSAMAAFPAEWPMPWGDSDESMPHLGFTLPYNMSGQPASSINAGFTADGRAIGLQIAGPRFADLEVLRLTRWYEQHRPASAVPDFAQGV